MSTKSNKKVKTEDLAFLGPIEGIESIFVDNFEIKEEEKNEEKNDEKEDKPPIAYFLSHYHWDHYSGNENFEQFLKNLKKENGVYIYASEVTVAIVKNEHGKVLKNIQYDVLRVLNLGENEVILTIDGKKQTLNVIAFDAKHCWGSLMFLFQYKDQNILYTGDFRITIDELLGTEYGLLRDLRENGQPIRINKMYVDTTFKMVPAFPKRSVVTSKIVELVKKWWEADKGIQIHIITSALFAYEDICNAIYDETGEKTKVRERKDESKVPRSKIYAQYPTEMRGIITDDSTYKIELYTSSQKPRKKKEKKENEDKSENDHVNENKQVNENENVRESEDKKDEKNKVKIIELSALPWVGKSNLLENFIEQEGNVTKMCFATHCGNDELFPFITYLNRIGEIPVKHQNSMDTLTSSLDRMSINN